MPPPLATGLGHIARRFYRNHVVYLHEMNGCQLLQFISLLDNKTDCECFTHGSVKIFPLAQGPSNQTVVSTPCGKAADVELQLKAIFR